MTLFCGSKMLEKDLDLVVLTSDTLFQCVEVILYLLHLLTLQLHDGAAVKADPLVHGVCQCAIFQTNFNFQFLELASAIPTIATPLNVKPPIPFVFLPPYVNSHQQEQRIILPLEKTMVQ